MALKEVAKDAGTRIKVGNYSLNGLNGLALAWDNLALVRDRVRKDSRLLLTYDSKLKQTVITRHVEKNMGNLRANSFVLSPVLHLVRIHQQLPNIDRLISEIQSVYKQNSKNVGGEIAYHEAWSIRKLISLLKSEGARLLSDPRRKCKDLRPTKARKVIGT